MRDIELVPLGGVRFDGTMLNLGATKEEATALLEQPDRTFEPRFYYHDGEFALAFDDEGKLEFIEFLAGRTGRLQPKIYGVYAFQAEADELYDLLRAKNGDAVDDTEAGYSYGFIDISVGIFRETTPEAVQEMIDNAIEELDEDEIAEETARATHWDTIGLGVEGYYRE